MHVDGEFEGNIHSKSTVIIGKNGIVKGNISAQKLVVNGKFQGDAQSSIIEILPMGKIEGKVITPEFVIERKGIFIGESKIVQKDTQVDKK